jgi:hypothetical protein
VAGSTTCTSLSATLPASFAPRPEAPRVPPSLRLRLRPPEPELRLGLRPLWPPLRPLGDPEERDPLERERLREPPSVWLREERERERLRDLEPRRRRLDPRPPSWPPSLLRLWLLVVGGGLCV